MLDTPLQSPLRLTFLEIPLRSLGQARFVERGKLTVFPKGKTNGSTVQFRSIVPLHDRAASLLSKKKYALSGFSKATFVAERISFWKEGSGDVLQKSLRYFSLLKTCEQLVYTVREKYVGKVPQLVWIKLCVQSLFTKPVQNPAVFQDFTRASSTLFPTAIFPRFNLLSHHLPTLSTVSTIITTVYK